MTKLRPEADAPGEIVDADGHVLGRHAGLIGFTIGQRRGLDVGGQAEPLYVVRLEPATNRVVVGPRSALAVAGVTLERMNWLGAAPGPAGMAVTVKLRSMAPLVPGWLMMDAGGGRIMFDAPQYGVAPGQAAVCYDGGRVLGGGFIGGVV